MAKKSRRKVFPDVGKTGECLCLKNGERFVVGTFHSGESNEITLLVNEYGQVRLPDEVRDPILIFSLIGAVNRRLALEDPPMPSRGLALLAQLKASGYPVLQPETPPEQNDTDKGSPIDFDEKFELVGDPEYGGTWSVPPAKEEKSPRGRSREAKRPATISRSKKRNTEDVMLRRGRRSYSP